MNVKNIVEIKNNALVKKRLAKYIALHCFRNSELENLHAGVVPATNTGDYSDVKVVSPQEEIPWADVSRFNDREMKELMIEVVSRCYKMLNVLYNSSKGDTLIEFLKENDPCLDWNDPQ